MSRIFRPADILIPVGCNMTKWSVVACDQYSSQPEYWQKVEKLVGDEPSSLRLMMPEAYLETKNQFEEAEKINDRMHSYLDRGIFAVLPESYIYVERKLSDGLIRRGLVGVLDLDAYDYAKDSFSPIRATEGTVETRLPPRVRVREGAELEMPHIMVFIDDEENTVLDPLEEQKRHLPKVYDFDLCCGGGHIKGWRVHGTTAEGVDAAIDGLSDPEKLKARYGGRAPAIFAMGDGNHSLATAKKCWEQIKPTLSEEERRTHPARFGMVELVNIHDDAIEFEPIHKVVFDTDTTGFIEGAQEYWNAHRGAGSGRHELRYIAGGEEKTVVAEGLTLGEVIGLAEDYCQSHISKNGGHIDYIHNDDTAIEMGRRPGCCAILLPKMEKSELFPSIISSGPFPKKSFSIGHAEDKRFYLECRKIK